MYGLVSVMEDASRCCVCCILMALCSSHRVQKEYTKKLHVQSARGMASSSVIMPPMSLPCLHTHHLVPLFRDVISAGHSGYLTVSLLYIPPLVVKVCEATKLPDTQRVGKQVRFTAPVLAS